MKLQEWRNQRAERAAIRRFQRLASTQTQLEAALSLHRQDGVAEASMNDPSPPPTKDMPATMGNSGDSRVPDPARDLVRASRVIAKAASIIWVWRVVAILMAMSLWLIAAWPAFACSVASPPSVALGSYSPAAVKASAGLPIAVPGGIDCSTTVLTLLSGNQMTATVTSTNGFKLTKTGQVQSGSYQLFLDAQGKKVVTPGTSINFLNTQVIDLLGLLGGSPGMIPFYVRPSSTEALPEGIYAGTFRVSWTWKFCSGVYVLGSCTLGSLDSGTGSADIAFTLSIAAKPILATVSTVTTWDPITGTSFPRAVSGSRRRVTITVTNPDIVPADLDTVRVEFPTPQGTALALQGDGASSGAAIRFADGTPSSALSFRFGDPGDQTDDVEFQALATSGWGYVPVVGDETSQGAVSRIRLKPRGNMAAGSTFTISLPYAIR